MAPAPLPIRRPRWSCSSTTTGAGCCIERGLAETTVRRYENTARRFLAQRAVGDFDPAVGVTSAEVNSFLLAECARCSVGAAKGRVAELRSLLRYLFVRELTATPLAAAVPPVAGWHNTGIPPNLSAEDVQAMLDSCDRGSPNGIRDLAILTLVARLGLRSIEVARMELDDVNWRTGEITIRGKARRIDTMPLPVEVGQALAGYLADARPSGDPGQRRLFLTGRAPRAPIHADLVSDVARRACLRAGLAPVGRTSAPARPGPADGGRGRGAHRHQPGAASPRPGHHSDLRQGRPRLAADGRQTVAAASASAMGGAGR